MLLLHTYNELQKNEQAYATPHKRSHNIVHETTELCGIPPSS